MRTPLGPTLDVQVGDPEEGKWAVREIRNEAGKVIDTVVDTRPDEWPRDPNEPVDGARKAAVARRIVACVNACSGIPTEETESGIGLAELKQQLTTAKAELNVCAALLPGTYYMDEPDGGDVSVPEQLRRMSADLRQQRDELLAALKSAVKTMRGTAQQVGPMHAWWDEIFDYEILIKKIEGGAA